MMKSIVITGATRGLGYGLAKEFLALGCQVTICGRNVDVLETAIADLSSQYSPEQILGIPCDVREYQQVKNLWKKAQEKFNQVDIWINNAAIVQPRYPVWQQQPEIISSVINTNLTGVIFGCKVAIEGMLAQGYGAVYNLEGSGSSGSKLSNFALYGTTKYGIRFLTESLVQETTNTPIIIGAISPGIVVTELVTKQYDETQKQQWEKVKPLLNILADKVETVTPTLAGKILNNQKTGVRIAWLTKAKVLRRFLTAPLQKRNLFQE